MTNYSLHEEIRDYWSERSKTFDRSFGHGIKPGAEAAAWQKPMRDFLPPAPADVLELACGTGEITRLVHDLGHKVTALDFSPEMLAVARAKHAGKANLRFVQADAGYTREPTESYDAILCRHLVWTLTDPEEAFRDWHRVLRSDGRLLIYDGDWATPRPNGRWAGKILEIWDRFSPDSYHDAALGEKHSAIMQQLPFGAGLRPEVLKPMLEAAGFVDVTVHSHTPIAHAQWRGNGLRNILRTLVWDRFIMTAKKP